MPAGTVIIYMECIDHKCSLCLWSGPPRFICLVSFTPIFSCIYCCVFIVVLSPFLYQDLYLLGDDTSTS